MGERKLFVGVTCYDQLRIGEVKEAGQEFVWQVGNRRLEIKFVADSFCVSHAEVRAFFSNDHPGQFLGLMFYQANLVDEFEVRVATTRDEIIASM